jgi:type VI secretion system protein ImpC
MADREGARVHWVILGSFSPKPSGRSFAMTRDDFAAELAKNAGKLTTKVTDRIGSAGEREYTPDVTALSSLTIAGLIKSNAELMKLAQLSEKIGGSITVDALLAEVEKVAGPGKLLEAVRAELEAGAPPAAPAPAAPLDQTAASDLLDEALAGTDAPRAVATTAVNAFVSALRPAGAAKAAPSSALKKARAIVEEAAYGTARDILTSPAVAAIEGAWRGLKLLLDSAPKSGLYIELVDVPVAEAAAKIRDRELLDSLEDPDAYFLVDDVASAETISELAELAEERLAPVVLSAAPSLWDGSTDVAGFFDALGEKPLEWWDNITKSEAARWLCVVANPVAIIGEGAGVAKRAGFASPVWAIAAMLSASFHAQGSFARVIGNSGALKSPGQHTIADGSNAGLSIPTKHFVSIRQQNDLEKHGIVGIGSPRNGDALMLSGIPTAFVGENPAALPAQILSGRIVRFTQWVRGQVDSTMSNDDVSKLFESASEVFLFPGMEKVAQVKATVASAEDGSARVLGILARVHASHAVTPLEISFGLPIR